MTTPTPAAIEAQFREWWAQSYPTPPGTHAVNTHVGFGTWLLERQAPIPSPSADEHLAAAREILGDDAMWGALERWAIQKAAATSLAKPKQDA